MKITDLKKSSPDDPGKNLIKQEKIQEVITILLTCMYWISKKCLNYEEIVDLCIFNFQYFQDTTVTIIIIMTIEEVPNNGKCMKSGIIAKGNYYHYNYTLTLWDLIEIRNFKQFSYKATHWVQQKGMPFFYLSPYKCSVLTKCYHSNDNIFN